MTDVGTLDDSTLTKFSHVRPGDTGWNSGGLRDFFMYRDLGIAAATHGRVLAQLVRANLAPPSTGTGWHRHDAEFHIVIMLKGWARFMYNDKLTLVKTGDCVHQRPGIVHDLFDYRPRLSAVRARGSQEAGRRSRGVGINLGGVRRLRPAGSRA
jgi:mannose-6-phosphate isomerase-like protein (cupin superfamily)